MLLIVLGAPFAVGCGSSSSSVSSADKNADGVRALVKEFVRDWRAGNYESACQLATQRQQAALAKATKTTCPQALAAARSVVGAEKLAADEKTAASLHVTVSGGTATSPNPSAPGETSHYVYRNGHWRIG